MVVGVPDGSGKTTFVEFLKGVGLAFHTHINADDIAVTLQGGTVDDRARKAQAEAAGLRDAALHARESFSYETVMSHPSHVELMRRARAGGYFVRLIFVGIDNPAINVARVANRVALGGHDVPTDRFRERYRRTMDESILEAVLAADESLVFDNSYGPGGQPLRVAHVIGRYARLYAPVGIGWPKRCLFDKLRAHGDFTLVEENR